LAGEEAQALRVEPLRRSLLAEMVGAPGILLIYSRLLSVLHPCSGSPLYVPSYSPEFNPKERKLSAR
jgi:hypothetical protein